MTHPQMNRRNFLKASAAAVVATTLANSPVARGVTFAQSATQDLEILNYALTLEHLEARAYKDIVASGLVTGKALEYFRMFGDHEAAHVVALTDTITKLGGTPVKALDKYNWPALRNQSEVLTFFQSVEELGAAAYLAQAPRLMNKDLITAAVSIHNVEGQHAAILSDMIGVAPSPAFASPKSMSEVLAVVTPLLSAGGTVPAAMPSTGRAAGLRGGR